MTAESTSTNKPEEFQNSVQEFDKTLVPAKYSLMGQIISDKYIVIDMIGEGSLSVVYLGQCGETRDSVAIKTLKYDNEELKKRFLETTQSFQDLKHPNIVDILEITESDEGLPVVVMKYVEGITIKTLLDNIGKIDDEGTLFSIVTGICEALEYTHVKNRYHGGLSPTQILIAEDQETDGFNVTINDYGTSLLSSQFAKEEKGHYLDDYLSPEQKKGEYFSVSTDIYSVAAIAYELITGHTPFQPDEDDPDSEPEYTPLTEFELEIAKVDVLNQLLEQALEQDPDWRMPNISQFKKELADWHEIALNEYYDDSEGNLNETDLNQYDDNELDDLEFEEKETEEAQVETNAATKEPQVEKEIDVISASTETIDREGSPIADSMEDEDDGEIADSIDGEIDKTVKISKAKPVDIKATQLEVQAKEAKEETPVKRKRRDRSAVKKTQAEIPEQPTQEAPSDVPVIDEEEIVKAGKREAKRRRVRKRRVTKSTQSNVRATIRNLVQLRENQTNQESTMVMQFTEKFANKGARQSPQKTILKLSVGAISFVVVFCLVLFNFDTIKGSFFAGSEFMGQLTAKQDEEETKKKVEIKDEKVKVIEKGFKKIKEEDEKQMESASKGELESSLVTRLKLKSVEKQTPLASHYYKNWRHRDHLIKNSKVGKRRRIDYKEFNKNWLK